MKAPLEEHAFFEKAIRFCLYRERCIAEVQQKLYLLGLSEQQQQQVIQKLISENYINQERYAGAFTRDKHRLKGWGRQKIKAELKRKKITEDLIKQAFAELDNDAYWEQLKRQTAKRWDKLKKYPVRERWFKTYGYLVSKGYEGDLIKDALNEVSHEQPEALD